MLKQSWGDKHDIKLILEAGNQRPHMTLRLNQLGDVKEYKQLLADNNIGFSQLAAQSDNTEPFTIILDQPVAVEKLPLFSEGRLSVQDAAAQLAAQLLAPCKDDYILDACAAPGGKTMHLFEQQSQLQKVVALDVDAQRLEKVTENSERVNIPAEKLHLQVADASMTDWWDGKLFDRILLDAPCSATGVIRRHPDIKLLRRQDDIQALAQLQAKILTNLWQMLKPGGTLLYATCSILRQENDLQIQAFITAQQQRGVESIYHQPINADWGMAMPVGRQILTGDHNMDGFYYAILKKIV